MAGQRGGPRVEFEGGECKIGDIDRKWKRRHDGRYEHQARKSVVRLCPASPHVIVK